MAENAPLTTFKIGDIVQPTPLWRDYPGLIPSGRVREIVPGPALYVEGCRSAFLDYVFEKVPEIAADAPLFMHSMEAAE